MASQDRTDKKKSFNIELLQRVIAIHSLTYQYTDHNQQNSWHIPIFNNGDNEEKQ